MATGSIIHRVSITDDHIVTITISLWSAHFRLAPFTSLALAVVPFAVGLHIAHDIARGVVAMFAVATSAFFAGFGDVIRILSDAFPIVGTDRGAKVNTFTVRIFASRWIRSRLHIIAEWKFREYHHIDG